MTEDAVLKELDVIVHLLTKYDFHARANWIKESKKLFSGDQTKFWAGINSLDWWGGSGSMADFYLYDLNSAITDMEQREDNRRFRVALVVIYEEMVKAGQKNERGEMWIDTFKKWQKQGIKNAFIKKSF
jgi:hypothetical protein